VFPIVGWALDANGIRQRVSPTGCNPATDATCHVLADIEVMVDGMVVGQANYPLPRPDIANAHPGTWRALSSRGSSLPSTVASSTNGEHTISVRVWNTEDLSTVLDSRDCVVQQRIRHPRSVRSNRLADERRTLLRELLHDSEPPIGTSAVRARRPHRLVSGWVIDQNDQVNLEGIVSVQLLLNGVQVK